MRPGLRMSAQSAGVSVSATKRRDAYRDGERQRELPVELARDAADEGRRKEHRRPARARCRLPARSAPSSPARSRRPARARPRCGVSTASTTTIASSTTRPIASTSPKSVSVLMLKPSATNAANVPISETGTASIGMNDERKLPRKIEDDDHDQPDRLEQRLDHVFDRVSDEKRAVVGDRIGRGRAETALCKLAPSSRERFARWRARLRPGSDRAGSSVAGAPVGSSRSSTYCCAPSSSRETSRKRRTEPSGFERTMISPNCLGRSAVPGAFTESWILASRGAGRLTDCAGGNQHVLLLDCRSRGRWAAGRALRVCPDGPRHASRSLN